MQHKVGRVQDYTNAFLGTLGLILFMAFWCIGALFGFFWVVLTAACLDQLRVRFIRVNADDRDDHPGVK
ncbi:hypothetical protein AN189_14790 [Loktanella sp. 3ANDIMAR09]|uniref:hypothetical protein n=1 Tax=Loktanella sp. 3ANDIMAR09 TaxID=1225657 RepID=UPI0006FB97CF|nr:hypothetical protein [Loktanella sp. 3ANDIMAR09]KQI67582.1 hypothetical protein AN189_14790 [Loktanella sp. 3ANDIMAR09]